MVELKPCPFCGGAYEKSEDGFVYSAVHESWCPLRGYGLTVVDAEEEIEAWNTRAERTCKPVDVYAVGVLDCGECGVQIANFNEPTPNYCPNCGAKVVGHETENTSDKNISRTKVVEQMEEISYKLTVPDPYQNAYERVIMEFNNRMRTREMEGIEAALKEHGYVKERKCMLEHVDHVSLNFELSCGHTAHEVLPCFCPVCGARVISEVE